jgi:hypothetical protein
VPKLRKIPLEKREATVKDIWDGLVKAFHVDQAVVEGAVQELFATRPELALRLQIQLCEVAKVNDNVKADVKLPDLVVSIRDAISKNKVKLIEHN